MCVICVLLVWWLPHGLKATESNMQIVNWLVQWIDMSWKIHAYNFIRSNWSLSNNFDLNICWWWSSCCCYFWNSNMQCVINAILITKRWYFYDGHSMFHVPVVHLKGFDWLCLFRQQIRSIKWILNDWRTFILFNWNKCVCVCVCVCMCVCLCGCKPVQFVLNNEMHLKCKGTNTLCNSTDTW